MRARRKELRWTQDRLGAEVGLTRGRVAQLEGGYAWTDDQIHAFARALGCRPSDLAPVERVGVGAMTPGEAAIILAARAGDAVAAFEALAAYMRNRPGR